MRSTARSLACLLLALSISACQRAEPAAAAAPHTEAKSEPPKTELPKPELPNVTLSFVRDRQAVRRLSLQQISAHAPARDVETDDPYYGARKRFRALPLNETLELAFGVDVASLRRESFVLRALDGYAVPVAGERLLEGGAYLAFDDLDVPGFAPIGPQRVSPAPTYLVWTKPGQSDLDTHPRPWQLATIEIASFEALYPHVVPTGEPEGSPAQLGFALFRDHCIKCHAINREGGRVGPDLNVPQSIVEYRPLAQIRAFIQDPTTFRYGAMPAHPQLTDSDLDALIAYLSAMSKRKHDAERGGKVEPHP